MENCMIQVIIDLDGWDSKNYTNERDKLKSRSQKEDNYSPKPKIRTISVAGSCYMSCWNVDSERKSREIIS